MKECYLCGSLDKLERHHLDWHHGHGAAVNLMWLCHRCHVELHKVGYLDSTEMAGVRASFRAERTPAVVAVS